jgi:hypothetical protein
MYLDVRPIRDTMKIEEPVTADRWRLWLDRTDLSPFDFDGRPCVLAECPTLTLFPPPSPDPYGWRKPDPKFIKIGMMSVSLYVLE